MWDGKGASEPPSLQSREGRHLIPLIPILASGHPLRPVPTGMMLVLTVSVTSAYQVAGDLLCLLVPSSPFQASASRVGRSGLEPCGVEGLGLLLHVAGGGAQGSRIQPPDSGVGLRASAMRDWEFRTFASQGIRAWSFCPAGCQGLGLRAASVSPVGCRDSRLVPHGVGGPEASDP